MKRGHNIWSGDTQTLRQLKLCSILLILYFVAIIIYILAIKDTKKQNVRQFSNKETKRFLVFLLAFLSTASTISINN
ncbi:hypothetical protein D0T08_00280 [Emticicia sp. C21]|nr:hypothetical protein D0T08_00280 [Emticicia sp. C21]